MSATAQATLSLHAGPFNAALQAASRNLNDFGSRLEDAIGGQVGKLAAVAAGALAVGSAFATLKNAAADGLRLNQSLEQTQTALATLLGQFGGDQMGNFAARTRQASRILDELREKGLYAEATFGQLTETLQMTAGNFFSTGIKGANEQIDAIVAVSQALAAYGGDQANLTSEVNALLSGQVRPWDKVAKGAGITSEALKKAQQEGRTFAFIMEKLAPITKDATQGMDSFASQLTINKELMDNFKTALMAPSFDALKEGLKSINEALQGEELQTAIKDISFQLGEFVRAGLSAISTLLSALPALLQIAGVISQALVPALAILALRWLTNTARVQGFNAKLGAMGSAIKTLVSSSIAQANVGLQTMGTQMSAQSSMAGRLGTAFRVMGMSVTRSITTMATTMRAQFASMLRSGALFAAGLQVAMAAATAGFMMAMNYAAKLEERTARLKGIMGQGEDNQSDYYKERGIGFDERGNSKKVAGGVSNDYERDKAVEAYADKIKKAKQELTALQSESDGSDSANANVDAQAMVVSNLEQNREALRNLTAEELAHNKALNEAAKAEEERQAAIAQGAAKIRDAQESLAKAQNTADLNKLSPQEQKQKLIKDAGMRRAFDATVTDEDVDNRISSLQSNQSSLTETQQAELVKLLTLKEQLIGVNEDIAKQEQRAAEAAAQRAQTEADMQSELREKAALARGDDKAAQAEVDARRKKQIEEQLVKQGFSADKASQMASDSVAADKSVRDAGKNKEQQENLQNFESELATAIAKATGNNAKSKEIEKEQRKKELFNQAKASGYDDNTANEKANQMLAAEESTKLRDEMDSALKNAGPAFASSMNSIGGGGASVGGGVDLLDENRRQTKLLQQIRDGFISNKTGKSVPTTPNNTFDNI